MKVDCSIHITYFSYKTFLLHHQSSTAGLQPLAPCFCTYRYNLTQVNKFTAHRFRLSLLQCCNSGQTLHGEV